MMQVIDHARESGLAEGRQALADALLSELDASRPDFHAICAELSRGAGHVDPRLRSPGLTGAEVVIARAAWQALANHLRAWLESGAPERPLLNEAWARINALGGRDSGDSIEDGAFAEAISRALAVIESLGGHDPAEKR